MFLSSSLLALSRIAMAAMFLGLAACAAMVPIEPSVLSPAPSASAVARFQFEREVTIKLSTGYQRTLAARSTWQRVGRIPQGEVYRPLDTLLTIEGRNVHEAYLVVNGTTLVGFYLPGESNYSPLTPPQTLPTGVTQ